MISHPESVGELLRKQLTQGNALAAPFVFDIRGAGGFWAVEFDFENDAAASLGFKNGPFAMEVQRKALENGIVVMGMTGGASLDGTKGDHIIFAPAYNITKEEIESIAEIFVKSVDEVLKESGL